MFRLQSLYGHLVQREGFEAFTVSYSLKNVYNICHRVQLQTPVAGIDYINASWIKNRATTPGTYLHKQFTHVTYRRRNLRFFRSRCHDIQHNDTQYNDIQHNRLLCDTQNK